jgi:hypothetical protein
MDDENQEMKLVQQEIAADGDVIGAVDKAVDKALSELDDAIKESQSELAKADTLYEEAEGVEHAGDVEDEAGS